MKYTVLTVEGDEAHRHLLGLWLRQGGFGMLPAATGSEALALAVQKKPDLVVLDIRLPDLDGCEVCRRLKANPQTSRMPVILHSGLDAASASEAGDSAGADAFLTHPIEPRELWAVLHRCLTRAAAAANAA